LAGQIEDLDASLADLEAEITSVHAQSEMARLLIDVPGIGKLIASAIMASVPDPSGFKSARDFAAWLGLTPKQNSSGGKPTLGAITKAGQPVLKENARVGCDLAPQGRAEAQRCLARLYCRAFGEEAGAACDCGAGQ
jgi:transposase